MLGGENGWCAHPPRSPQLSCVSLPLGLGQFNSNRMLVVRDRREYHEHTVLNWIASKLGDRAAASGSSAEQVPDSAVTNLY